MSLSEIIPMYSLSRTSEMCETLNDSMMFNAFLPLSEQFSVGNVSDMSSRAITNELVNVKFDYPTWGHNHVID